MLHHGWSPNERGDMLPRKLLPFARVLKERFPGILIQEIVRFFSFN